MEKRLKTPDLFKFPFFEAICWFVAKNLLENLKELREDGFHPPNYLKQGVKALITALKNWMKKESVAEHAFEIPENIRPGNLVKELSKVIRSVEEEGSKPVKSQGLHGLCPLSGSSHEASSHHSKRKARRLRDHASKAPSNLDILEHHTREVLKRLEMSPWQEDMGTYKLNMKALQPSSTVPDKQMKDHGFRLLLSNGRIVRDERQPFTDRSLYTADSEDEDDRGRSKKTKDIQLEKPCSSSEADDKGEHQKPLNMFFESVKSELRYGTSEYSDISDSEGSEGSCTNQKSGSEDSDSSGDEQRREDTDVKEEDTEATYDDDHCWSASTTSWKSEFRSSTSTVEDAVEGMLTMASLHYPSRSPAEARSPGCKMGLVYPQLHIKFSQEKVDSQEPKLLNNGHCGDEDTGLTTSDWISQMDSSCRSDPQDFCKAAKSHRREHSTESSGRSHKIKRYSESEGWDSPRYHHDEKYDQEGSLSPGDYDISEGSLSPDRIYGDASPTVPLHPTKRPASNPPPISNQATKGKRPKKGMATAKQRLGKILKLNRHGHARFFV